MKSSDDNNDGSSGASVEKLVALLACPPARPTDRPTVTQRPVLEDISTVVWYFCLYNSEQ